MSVSSVMLVKKLDKKIAAMEKKTGKNLPGAVDQVFKWVALTAVAALDLIGQQGRHSFKKRLLIAASGKIFLNAMVEPVKKTINRERPNHSANANSFPSSHTATAFLGAEILHQELKRSNKPLSYSGYVLAAAAGGLRIYNNKHWFSDVIAGMALGIITGKLVCKVFHKLEKKTKASHDSRHMPHRKASKHQSKKNAHFVAAEPG